MARKSRKQIVPEKETVEQVISINELSARANALPTAAYIRLSVENSGHDSDDTIQTQISLVESYINSHEELSLIETYVDNGFTGTKFDRPEFMRMMDDVKNGKISCIVVKDLSRFGRDYLETGYYIENIFPLLNVRFIAITDNFDSIRQEDVNSLSVPIKNMVNAMYAKDYSRKQEVFRDLCKKNARVMGNNAAYGYLFDPEKQRLVINTEVEPYVRMVFAWFLAGIGKREIADRMNIVGAPTPAKMDGWDYGYTWTPDTVVSMVYNPVYAGYHVMGKSKVSLYKNMPNTNLERSEWLMFPNYHEPYITQEEYEQIENIIIENKRIKEKRWKRNEKDREKLPQYFVGMVYCADCGKRMRFFRGAHHRGYQDLSFQYYRCKYGDKKNPCNNRRVQQNFLIMVVMDQINNLIKVACDRDKLLRDIEKSVCGRGKINSLKRKIARLEEKIHVTDDKILKAYMNFVEGLLEEDEYQFIKQKLGTDKEELEKSRDEIWRKLQEMEQTVKRYHDLADHLSEYMDSKEFNEELVNELVHRIYVGDQGKIEIVFNCEDVFQNALIDEFITGHIESDNVDAYSDGEDDV